MDRQTIYPGQLPRSVDFLTAQQDAMVALAELSQTVFGTPTLVDSFTVTPTSPASLSIIITPGTIYQLESLEATVWSSLPANISAQILKQGVEFVSGGASLGVGQPATVGITPPGTVGYSQNFLVEVQYQDVDGGALVLPYYNAANPQSNFAGPANNGLAQNTVRYGGTAYQVKAGTAATTGTQTTPSPDAGWTGIFVVTVAYGAATITSGNITAYSGAPFLATNGHLPQIPTGVQNNTWTYAADTSVGGAATATNSTTATSSAVLHFASVPGWITAGMTAFDITTVGAITGGQTVLSTTGTTVTLSANVNATVGSGDSIAFSYNTMAASISPAPASLAAGLSLRVKAAGTTSNPSGSTPTLNLNGLGAVSIHRANSTNLVAGDITAGMVFEVTYDGAYWQLVNFDGLGGSVTNTTTTVSIPYATDSGSVNALVANFTPAISSLTAGLTIEVNVANTNIGASTINVNSLGVKSIVDNAGNALTAGCLQSGYVSLLVYNGTVFQLVNTAPKTLAANKTWYVNASSGSDTLYDGTQATVSGSHGPFATIQNAVNVAATFNMNGYNQTINVANGAYANVSLPQTNGSGTVFITGNNSTPASCTITGTGSGVVGMITNGNCSYQISGFRVSTTGSGALDGINASGPGATLIVQDVQFGPCGRAHLASQNGALMWLQGNIIIEGGATATNHMLSSLNGQFDVSSVTAQRPNLTINGSVSITYWAESDYLSIIQVNYQSFSGYLNVSGSKWFASANGIIQSFGGGINYFPGTTGSGVAQTGGQYIS